MLFLGMFSHLSPFLFGFYFGLVSWENGDEWKLLVVVANCISRWDPVTGLGTPNYPKSESCYRSCCWIYLRAG